MRVLNLRFTPFEFIQLRVLHMLKTVDEHAELTCLGVIDEKNRDAYIKLAEAGTAVSAVGISADGKEKVLFKGSVAAVDIFTENDVHLMELRLITDTSKMDCVEKVRTFQDPNTKYEDILNALGGTYSKYAFVMAENGDAKTNGMVVQYNETDWEFVKRLATNLNSFVVPDYSEAGPRFLLGMPNRNNGAAINSATYRVVKDMADYRAKAAHGLPVNESAYVSYIVRDRNTYDLCESVKFNGREMFVYGVESELQGGELVHTYTLKSRGAFISRTVKNKKLIGASLDGKVTAVQRDMVQVSLDVDADNPVAGNTWLRFSTVFSSPDGAGWYAMPEPDTGDEVRLYFPSEDDNAGYVVSAVHLSAKDPARTNPDEKSFKNKQGKEIRMTPTGIVLTNNNGISITIDDNTGIYLESSKDITISAEDTLSVLSQGSSVTFTGASQVKLDQDNSAIVLEGDVYLTGTQVHIQ